MARPPKFVPSVHRLPRQNQSADRAIHLHHAHIAPADHRMQAALLPARVGVGAVTERKYCKLIQLANHHGATNIWWSVHFHPRLASGVIIVHEYPATQVRIRATMHDCPISTRRYCQPHSGRILPVPGTSLQVRPQRVHPPNRLAEVVVARSSASGAGNVQGIFPKTRHDTSMTVKVKALRRNNCTWSVTVAALAGLPPTFPAGNNDTFFSRPARYHWPHSAYQPYHPAHSGRRCAPARRQHAKLAMVGVIVGVGAVPTSNQQRGKIPVSDSDAKNLCPSRFLGPRQTTDLRFRHDACAAGAGSGSSPLLPSSFIKTVTATQLPDPGQAGGFHQG